jgi:transcriptional regulator with XRE-family HTH domain
MATWRWPVWLRKWGLNRSFLADVERGKSNISILNLELIAKGLELSLSRILSGL